MAFTTGIAGSINDLYDAIASFVGSNGWTLIDTVSARDKVFTSKGTSGKRDMIYRLTLNTEAGFPIKGKDHPNAMAPTIVTRGYLTWDTDTHTGTGAFGRFGPHLRTAGSSGSGAPYYRLGVSTLPVQEVIQSSWPFQQFSANDFQSNRIWSNGGRGVVTIVAATTRYDLIVGDVAGRDAVGAAPAAGQGCASYDESTNRTYCWAINGDILPNSQMRRYSLEDKGVVNMANAAWTSGAIPAMYGIVWDGADHIYVTRGANTTSFSKYAISTDTWTDLAATPIASSNTSPNRGKMVYVPASVTGFAEDVCLMLLTNNNQMYRYNVASNTWGPHVTLPQNVAQSDGLLWDGERYLYHFVSSASTTIPTLYRCDLTVTPLEFKSMGITGSSSSASATGTMLLNFFVSRLRGSNSLSQKFWVSANEDGVVIVNRIDAPSGPMYYYMGFGQYHAARNPNVMTLTAPTTPGTNKVVSVDSTDGYFVGDTVTLFDPSTGALARAVVQALTGTSFTATLHGSFGIGARVGADPFQHGAYGDTGILCAPVNGLLKHDYESNTYPLSSMLDVNALVRNNPNKLGVFGLGPTLISHHDPSLSRYENLGTLMQVYQHPRAAYPGLQSEDEVSTALGTYKFFPVEENERFMAGTVLGILMGPID